MSGSAELEQLDVLDGLLTRTREALVGVLGPESRLLPLDVAAQRLVDRASTSYREGYEAGKAATPHPGFRECVRCAFAWDERQGVNCPNCEVIAPQTQLQARPVLASNPLDPKCANIFEAAEILASVTACMSKLAKALEEMSEKAEAAEKRCRDLEEALELIRAGRDHYRNAAWEADAGLTSAREQLRLMTKERDEWRDAARATQERLGRVAERAERAEKALTPWVPAPPTDGRS